MVILFAFSINYSIQKSSVIITHYKLHIKKKRAFKDSFQTIVTFFKKLYKIRRHHFNLISMRWLINGSFPILANSTLHTILFSFCSITVAP